MLVSSRNSHFATVLVVDDDRDTAESMACLLRLFGHDVQVALNGYQAIEIARRQRPNYVLLDLGLPGLDGYDVASRLRQEGDWPFVLIAITGYGREHDRRRALAAGFDHLFVKPLDGDGLNTLLSTLDAGPWGLPDAPVAQPVPLADEGAAASPSFRGQPGGRQMSGDFPTHASPPPESMSRQGRLILLVSRQVEITDPLGLHLRAADQIVRLARRFRADVRGARDGGKASGLSILEPTMLAASCGSRLQLEADGPDAEAALDALTCLIGRGFDEQDQ